MNLLGMKGYREWLFGESRSGFDEAVYRMYVNQRTWRTFLRGGHPKHSSLAFKYYDEVERKFLDRVNNYQSHNQSDFLGPYVENLWSSCMGDWAFSVGRMKDLPMVDLWGPAREFVDRGYRGWETYMSTAESAHSFYLEQQGAYSCSEECWNVILNNSP